MWIILKNINKEGVKGGFIMKKLLLLGLLLIPVLVFSGCASSSESVFNTEGSMFGGKHFANEKAYFKTHIPAAKKVYKLCEMNIAYYNAHSDRCNIAYYALKDSGNLPSYKSN